ncbi:unnamed protein product [Rhizoctonia solani]|uniref:Uncharacterized protein n=1 Tax=Rhizoctonia solani TaxID=456999 RepID=A0A8H2WA70_9AGAM|nr:unnamed protein product [Rhizoctonia solani]
MSPYLAAAVRRWEDLGRQLEKTAMEFLDSCEDLSSHTSTLSTTPKELIWKIDNMLHSINNRTASHTNDARQSLAQARNKLAAPVHCLPEETMARVFLMAMESMDTDS